MILSKTTIVKSMGQYCSMKTLMLLEEIPILKKRKLSLTTAKLHSLEIHPIQSRNLNPWVVFIYTTNSTIDILSPISIDSKENSNNRQNNLKTHPQQRFPKNKNLKRKSSSKLTMICLVLPVLMNWHYFLIPIQIDMVPNFNMLLSRTNCNKSLHFLRSHKTKLCSS